MKGIEEDSSKKVSFFCLILTLSFLFGLTSVLSVQITSCSSGGLDGICEIGQICTCSISGKCTDGNLLLYLTSLTNPICSPQIVGSSAQINWNYCNFTEGLVYAMADCDEGQSAQKTIMVSQPEETTESTSTTTSIYTTTEATTTEGTNQCFGGNGYCEDMMADCQTGYTYCPENNNDCPGIEEKCCCSSVTHGGIIPPNFNFKLVIFLVVAVVIGVALFLFFVTQTKKGMSFDKLYKKWNK